MIGYTLSSTTADGVTTVKAKVTDSTNISSTRKVSSFIAGDADDACSGDTYNGVRIYRHVDNGAAYCNGAPNDYSYDVAIYCGTQFLMIWGANTRSYGYLVILGGTLKAKTSSSHQNLAVKHVMGNGVLSLRHVGLRRASGIDMTFDSTVTVEFSRLGICDTTDTWAKSDGTGTTTVNGPVVVTNGFLKVYGNVVFNGPVTICALSTDGHRSCLSNATTINSTWTIEDGGDFDFASKTVTMGADTKLVLEGSAKITGASGVKFPTIVLGEGYSGTFGAMNATETYEVDGGTLTIASTGATGTGTNVVIRSGALRVDFSSVGAAEQGATFEIPGVSLGEGVDFSTLTVTGIGARNEWTATLSATGVITFTATSAAEAYVIHWVGAATGDADTGTNWDYGVPTSADTVVIDHDVTITYSKAATREWGGLTLENGATLTYKSTDYGKYYSALSPHAISGTGTLVLVRAGLNSKTSTGGLTVPATIKIYIDNNGAYDSWLEGSSTQHLTILGDVEAHGKTIVYNYVKFGGDTKAKLTGDGQFLMQEEQLGVAFDDADFTGNFKFNGYYDNKNHYVGMNGLIDTPHSTWTASDFDIYLKAPGTNRIGTLNFDDATWRKAIYCQTAGAYTLEVGGGKFGTKYFCAKEYGTGADVTLRKVGTGTLTYAGYGIPKIEVVGGTLALAEQSVTDEHTYLPIDSITLAEGATLSGGVADKIEVKSLAFARGTFLKQSLAYDTTTTEGVVQTNGLKFAATLAVAGDVDLTGVTCVVGNTNLLVAAKKNMESPIASGCTFNFLTTTGALSGKPETETTRWVNPAKEKGGYQPADSDASWGWVAKAHAAAAVPSVSLEPVYCCGLVLVVR